MSERREQVIAQIKAIVKLISDTADTMGDCGGMQGAAVMGAFPDITNLLKQLGKEAEKLGVTAEELKAHE